jgi:hypothetical protein
MLQAFFRAPGGLHSWFCEDIGGVPLFLAEFEAGTDPTVEAGRNDVGAAVSPFMQLLMGDD